jgi:ABC-2 type transport system permease protein
MAKYVCTVCGFAYDEANGIPEAGIAPGTKWGDLSGVNWLLMFAAVVLIAVTSTFLGLFIAVSVSEVFEAQTFSNFFRFPMMFLCGLFIPIENLPVFIRPLSYLLPLTYGADMLKYSVNSSGFINPPVSLLILIGCSIALFTISTNNIKRKWIY